MKFPYQQTNRHLTQLVAAAVVALASFGATAQQVTDVGTPPAVIPVVSELPAALHVFPPIPEALARGVVILQFKTENFRVIPVFGKGALGVSPRVGHLHVTVDGMALTWAHTSGDPIIVVGLKPGPHEILVELADPSHRIVTAKRMEFVLPDASAASVPTPEPAHIH